MICCLKRVRLVNLVSKKTYSKSDTVLLTPWSTLWRRKKLKIFFAEDVKLVVPNHMESSWHCTSAHHVGYYSIGDFVVCAYLVH